MSFKCLNCGKSYLTEKNVQTHWQDDHGRFDACIGKEYSPVGKLVDENFTCPICDVEQDNIHMLNRHLIICSQKKVKDPVKEEEYRVPIEDQFLNEKHIFSHFRVTKNLEGRFSCQDRKCVKEGVSFQGRVAILAIR